jgi:cell division septation protein DedD
VRSRSVSGPRLYVQYGAFSVKSNALDLKRRLSNFGFKPFIVHGSLNGSDIYRVRVGPYRLVSEVDDVAARSRQVGYETKLVVE